MNTEAAIDISTSTGTGMADGQARPAGRHFKAASIMGPVGSTLVGTLAVLVVTLGAPGEGPAHWWMLATLAAVGIPLALIQFGAARRDREEASR